MKCLFCESDGPCTTIEHIVPQSLGNDDYVLTGDICDKCQNYFGKEIEQYVLSKTPIAFWRTFLGIKTKSGKLPSIDLRQPNRQSGFLPSIHPRHDNVGFAYHDYETVSVDIDDGTIVRSILKNSKTNFTFVFTPKHLHMLGRFLCKVGVESLCFMDNIRARQDQYEQARRFARFGQFAGLWPIFHYSKGNISDLIDYRIENGGTLEDAFCYDFSLLYFADKYTLFRFSMGTDNWIVCLNDPYPNPTIRIAYSAYHLNLIWYDSTEWTR